MKKHNEGYTLPFVLVVFLVLSLVVVTVLTVAVNNLHSQKVSIQRMEEQYAAQGAVEKLTSYLCDTMTMSPISAASAEAAFSAKLANILKTVNEVETGVQIVLDPIFTPVLKVDTDNKTFSYQFAVISRTDNMQISCTMTVTGTCEDDTFENTTVYTLGALKVGFQTYRIASAEPPTEAVGGAVQ